MQKRSSRRRKFVTPWASRRAPPIFALSQSERAVGHPWACFLRKTQQQVPVMTPKRNTRGKSMRKVLLCALGAIVASVDHGMKLQQTLGSARAAEEAKNYDTALSKLEQISTQLAEWRSAIVAAQKEAATPAEPAAAPEPPAESIPFSVNSTHVPDKCTRKSEEGAVMKVLCGASWRPRRSSRRRSTGSQPFRCPRLGRVISVEPGLATCARGAAASDGAVGHGIRRGRKGAVLGLRTTSSWSS